MPSDSPWQPPLSNSIYTTINHNNRWLKTIFDLVHGKHIRLHTTPQNDMRVPYKNIGSHNDF